MSATMAPNEYLKRPYGRVVVPESDGTFRAEIMEFPGCLATGDTATEALANLEAVAMSWLEATIARGLHVPEPIDGGSYSGKLVARLGSHLHRRAAHVAAVQGISINQFIVSSVAERVGMFARPSMLYTHPANLQANFTLQVGAGWQALSGPASRGLVQSPVPTGTALVPVDQWQEESNA